MQNLFNHLQKPAAEPHPVSPEVRELQGNYWAVVDTAVERLASTVDLYPAPLAVAPAPAPTVEAPAARPTFQNPLFAAQQAVLEAYGEEFRDAA